MVSEDAINDLLKKLIRQWPEIDKAVTILPGRGYHHLLSKKEAKELCESRGNKFKILVHRDRDSLTDAEVATLKQNYHDNNIRLWMTDQSDIEAEFCSPQFLAALTGHPITDCRTWLDQVILQNQTIIKDQFVSQRAAHNTEMHAAGGGPTNADVWTSFQSRPLKGAKGKFIFKQLKNKVPGKLFSEQSVAQEDIFPEAAASLKSNLQDLLA